MKLPNPYGEVRLDTEAVFRGLWDVTGTNHPSVPGELRYSPESGLQLRIVRHRDATGNGLAIRGVSPVITGSIENGTRLVRLEHCWLRQSDFDCFDIFAMRALVGGADPAAFEQLAKGVTGVTFDLASVDHWLGWPRYSNDLPIDWANPGVHLASSGEQECAVASGRLAQSGGFISLNPAIKVSGVPGGRSIVAGPLVQLSFEGVKSIDEAEGAALNTVFLLNLLIGYNSRIRSLGFNVGSDTYYRLHTSKTAIPTQEPLGRPLTMATELDFPAALDAWLMLCGEAPNVINRLQSLLWKWSSLLDDEISVAAQALEGLGEHLFPQKYLTKGEFRALKARLMEAMEGQPPALVERSEGSFGHLNKPSLKTLIRRLVEALPPENADAVLRTRRGEGREEAIGRFVKRVSECRNDVAHGRELKTTAEPDEGLLLLIARMKLLLMVHLLLKVGVPHEILIAKYRVAESWIWG